MAEKVEFTDEEKQQMISRALALALTITKAANELTELMGAVRDTKPRTKREVDDQGEPTYRFKVKVRIPDDIKLTSKMRAYAVSKGFNASTVQPVWESFLNYYRRAGTKWMDWSAVWQKWVRTELERRAAGGGQRSSRDLPQL